MAGISAGEAERQSALQEAKMFTQERDTRHNGESGLDFDVGAFGASMFSTVALSLQQRRWRPRLLRPKLGHNRDLTRRP